jgi:hypothetical protein
MFTDIYERVLRWRDRERFAPHVYPVAACRGHGSPPDGPPAPGGLEFETDAASFLLLEDGVSYLLLEA